MTRALRNISASVEKRLLNLSRQSGEDFQYVLMRYGLERLMYRLSRSVYAKEFVVKGAMLLRVWTGEQYRPTKDLDLLAILDKSPEELNQIFRDVCTLNVEGDGLVFLSETIRVRQIREDNVYGGMRVTLESRLGKIRIPLQVDIGFVYVDGSSVGEITDADLKDRRILGEEGFISVIVVVDSATGKIVSGPEIHARGVAEDDRVFDSVKPKIAAALAEAAKSGVRDNHALSQVVRRTIGRWVNQSLRRRPMIVPMVIEA